MKNKKVPIDFQDILDVYDKVKTYQIFCLTTIILVKILNLKNYLKNL